MYKAWANSINLREHNRQLVSVFQTTTTIRFVHAVLCLHLAIGCRYYMKDEQYKQHIHNPMQGSYFQNVHLYYGHVYYIYSCQSSLTIVHIRKQ